MRPVENSFERMVADLLRRSNEELKQLRSMRVEASAKRLRVALQVLEVAALAANRNNFR
jgi:hypothetical protein